MSSEDARRFHDMAERVDALEDVISVLFAKIANLNLRLGGLQGQINALRRSPAAALPPEDQGDAARQ
jgi:hypothetical protein